MHTHEFQGQKLVHSHPGEDQEHGYFEHPEDGFPLTADYTPRVGDPVRVRRWVKPNGRDAREDESVYVGRITEARPHADGWFIDLDSHPDQIFTGYQFVGTGSLLTEVAPLDDTDGSEAYRVQVTPDLAVILDGSQCVVLEVSEAGRVLRRVTVTNVAALKTSLDGARAAQREVEAAGRTRRYAGPDEARRARGQLTKIEAVEWLITHGTTSRAGALRDVNILRDDGADVPPGAVYGMTYADGYWRVPEGE
jgi:hypothetical protein